MLAAERGYRCLVLRLSDRDRPEAETLRNQAWLQSGALFTRLRSEPAPTELSRRLRAQGQRLLSLLNLPRSASRGLARFPLGQEEEIERFIEDARDEWQKIYSVLPPALQPDRSSDHRFTCGYEVMRGGPDRVRKEDLIVEPVEGFDGVVLALPGRATLAHRAAELVLEELAMQKAAEMAKPPVTTRLRGNRWSGPVAMHHQSLYDNLDERAEERHDHHTPFEAA